MGENSERSMDIEDQVTSWPSLQADHEGRLAVGGTFLVGLSRDAGAMANSPIRVVLAKRKAWVLLRTAW